MPEGITQEHIDDEEFDLGLTEEEIEELARKQEAGDAEDAGFASPEKVSAAGVADEIKIIIENRLGINASEIDIRESKSGNTLFMVGTKNTGYINISVENGNLKLMIPPSFNEIRDDITHGAEHVFAGGGKAGPRGV